MAKHRWRESFRSFFGNHIDPIKEEELKENKAEIEGDVEKIIEALKDDAKEPLIKLIENFHNHYQSLYARYDHLTEELRKEADSKHWEDSSSSSNSDDSPKKDSAKIFDNELERALSEVDDLKRKLAITIGEKETLHQEYQSELSKQQEAEKKIIDLNDEKSRLLSETTDLKVELESSLKLLAEVRQELDEIIRDRESLIIEKNAALMKTEEEKRSTEELRTINSQLQNDKNAIQLELQAVKGEISTLMEKLDLAKSEIAKLSAMQMDVEKQKTSLTSKISQLQDEVKHGENKNQDLVTKSSQLSKKLAEKERELSSQLESYKAYKEAAETVISKANQMYKAAEEENCNLSITNSELQDDMKEATHRIQDLITVATRLSESYAETERELSSHLEIHEAHKEETSRKLKSTADEITGLIQTQKAMEEEKTSLSLRISQLEDDKEKAENKILDLVTESSELAAKLVKKEGELSSHLEIQEVHRKEAKRELESAENEISKLIDMLKAAEDKNASLSLKILQLENENKQAENKIQDLAVEKSRLSEKFEDKERELSSHLEIHESYKDLASTHARDLERELDASHTLRIDLVKEKENIIAALLMELSDREMDTESLIHDLYQENIILMVKLEYLRVHIVEKFNSELIESIKERGTLLLRLKDHGNEQIGLVEQLSNRCKDLRLLQEEKENLEKTVIERESEVSTLKKKSEDGESKARSEIAKLTKDIKSLQEQLESVDAQRRRAEISLETKRHETFVLRSAIEQITQDLKARIAEAEKLRKDKKGLLAQIDEAVVESNTLRSQIQMICDGVDRNLDLEVKLTEARKELVERQEEIECLEQQLEVLVRSNQDLLQCLAVADKKKSELERKSEDLEIKVDEMKKALEDAEVQQRLTRQKLHVTEQMYVEKEESSMEEERMLSGVVSGYEQVVSVILKGMDALQTRFDEAYGEVESHVCEMVKEVKVIRNMMRERNEEREELMEEIVSLFEEVSGEKHKRLVMKGVVDEAEKRVHQDEDEKEELMARVGEREKEMREKEVEIVRLKEEKIEAIKELSKTIEYHRNSYCLLKEMVKKTRTRQAAADH